MSLIDTQNSLVIDVTYNCNAKCVYCKWGHNATKRRTNQSDNYIFITKKYLQHLNIERIVFSGGEPLLRKDLNSIISYYKEHNVKSIIVITNGILLNEKMLKRIVNAGVTGITFSIDSFDNKTAFETRAYTNSQINKIKSNFIKVASLKQKYNLELGINTVISSANIQNNQLEKLIEYVNNFPIDWIKFQPIFEDNFVKKNASHLLLSSKYSKLVRETGKRILDISKMETNNINFWNSLSDILSGKKLDGATCGLDTRQAIAQNGKIKICSWINFPTYEITNEPIKKTQQKFLKVKQKCKTGTHCFCLQNLKQTWKTI